MSEQDDIALRGTGHISRETAVGPNQRVRIGAVSDESGAAVRVTDRYGRSIQYATVNEWAPDLAREVADLLYAAADHADQILGRASDDAYPPTTFGPDTSTGGPRTRRGWTCLLCGNYSRTRFGRWLHTYFAWSWRKGRGGTCTRFCWRQ